MLCVGIDVSKNKHDVAVINTEGEILLEHLQISNDREGFDNLHQTLSQLINKTANDTRIALEDTGHYSFNILSFLRTMGYQVSTYNPLLIKEFAKTITLRKTKTDKKDALTIAKKLLIDQAPERFDADEQIQELKYLTRHRERLIQKQTDLKVQYTKVLDLIFPELASVLSKMGTHNQSTYDLLKKYPSPKKIQRARPTSLGKIKHLNKENIDKIQDKAKTTIWTCSIALEFELLQTINLIEYFKSVIKEVDTEINVLMVKIDSPILSIPGISTTLGSVILAEIKTITNFQTPAQLLAFAGLEPSIYQSGQSGIEGRMVKRGSTHLRWALIQAARLVARWSPTFNTYLDKKLAQGKHYKVALSHVAKKLVRVIFHL